MCCLSSPEGSRSGEATAQMTCQQETLYSDNRRGAAQVQHITYAVVLLSAHQEYRLWLSRGIYSNYKNQRPALAVCPGCLLWVQSLGLSCMVLFREDFPFKKSCSTYLRIHGKKFPGNFPQEKRDLWVPPCSMS